MNRHLILCLLLSFILVNIGGCNNDGDEGTIIENTGKESLDATDQKQDRELIDRKTGTLPQEQVATGPNHPPVVKSIRIERISGTDTGNGFRAIVEATDPDGDVISFRYQWKLDGDEIPGATDEILEWREGFKRGSIISIAVIPFDGQDEGVWNAEGSYTIPNSPPIITSEPVQPVEDGKFSYTIKAEDPDGDPIEYTLKNAPIGMTLEPATGLITWDFGEAGTGQHIVEIVVTDSEGAKTSQTLTLNIAPRNQ